MTANQSTRTDSGDIPPTLGASSLKGLTAAVGIEPAEPGHDPLLGVTMGDVKIVRLIAEGGMGRVYEGKQEKPNRTVAVKVMRPGLASPSLLKRFEYEAEVLGRLQHPGIAHIYTVGVHRVGNANVPYFIMEYVADAKTLTKYAADLKLPIRQRLDLFRSVCDAVSHGHQRGVIHRDLKPNNILVDSSGQPKVIDFGVARVTDSDMALTTIQTDVGQIIGTFQYMSPEQFNANPNDIDIRSDVYALGVILYELLAGVVPYDLRKKAVGEMARIVQHDTPAPLSAVNRALKGDLSLITRKCLEKDRGLRYSTASELDDDIKRHLSGVPIQASSLVFPLAFFRLVKRHRSATAATAITLASFVVASPFLLSQPAPSSRPSSVATLPIGTTGIPNPDLPANPVTDFDYAIIDDTVKILKFVGSATIVKIPESIEGRSVTVIGRNSFRENRDCTEVILPETTKVIEAEAFFNCSWLRHITIPKEVCRIEEGAFAGCGLAELFLPAHVADLSNPIYQCPTLMSIKVDPANESFKSIDGILYDKNLTAVLRCPEGRKSPVALPRTINHVERMAFHHCVNLSSVILPDAVASIGQMAFYRCTKLERIEIPPNVKKLEARTFVDCRKLEAVILNEGLEEIDDGVFWGCYSLSSIKIPASVKTIHPQAFNNCPAKVVYARPQ